MNEMSRSPPAATPEFQPTELVTAALEAQEWNLVLVALNEVSMPMRLLRPVVDKLLSQLTQRAPPESSDVSH